MFARNYSEQLLGTNNSTCLLCFFTDLHQLSVTQEVRRYRGTTDVLVFVFWWDDVCHMVSVSSSDTVVTHCLIPEQ